MKMTACLTVTFAQFEHACNLHSNNRFHNVIATINIKRSLRSFFQRPDSRRKDSQSTNYCFRISEDVPNVRIQMFQDRRRQCVLGCNLHSNDRFHNVIATINIKRSLRSFFQRPDSKRKDSQSTNYRFRINEDVPNVRIQMFRRRE